MLASSLQRSSSNASQNLNRATTLGGYTEKQHEFNSTLKKALRSTPPEARLRMKFQPNSPLKENAFNSVFAKALKVDHLKPEQWPSSPLDFDGLFKGLIMNDLIERGDFSAARKQWLSRLHAERSLIEAYADDPGSTKYGDASVALEKYLKNRVPVLMWEGEQILYNGGDKRDAVIALFGILEKYPAHPKYLEWVEWFKSALSE